MAAAGEGRKVPTAADEAVSDVAGVVEAAADAGTGPEGRLWGGNLGLGVIGERWWLHELGRVRSD